MLEVINAIADCGGHDRERDLAVVRHLMVHRFGSHELAWYDENEIAPTAMGIAQFYQRNPEASAVTGGRMPYTFVISTSGMIEQAADLGSATPHARRFSHAAVGIACLGDFRVLPPTQQQLASLTDLIAGLARFFDLSGLAHCRWPLGIVGHTSIAGATSDTGKDCPGKLLDVSRVASDARAINEHEAARALSESGIII